MKKGKMEILIIATFCMIVLIGFFIFKTYNDKKTNNIDEYLDVSTLTQLTDNYYALIENDIITKITNNKGKVLIKLENGFDNTICYYVENEDLYIACDSLNNSNLPGLYKLSEETLTTIFTGNEDESYYVSRILYINNDEDTTIGLYIEPYGDYGSNLFYSYKYNKLIDLNGYSLGDDQSYREAISIDIDVHSENYIILLKYDNALYFGLIDLEGNIIIEPEYTELYYAGDDRYIALKDGTAGIIDANNNVLVEFIYDHIGIGEESFLMVKDNKMALYDYDLNQLTDFEMDYLAGEDGYSNLFCCSSGAPIEVVKNNDEYIVYSYSFINTYYISEDDPGLKYTYYISLTGEITSVNKEEVTKW